MKKNTAAWARDLARKHLETSLPRRWAHTQGVARQARILAPLLGNQADFVEAAAWLHDIGYAPDLVDTGFHPLDGARYLRDTHLVDNHLCRLVAHHSCALVEARERGVDRTLTTEFGAIAPHLSDSLLFCDMTTSPDGTQLTAKERLNEILARYGTEHVVSRSIRISSINIINTVERIEETLNGQSPR
ncbi:HD domain-containing protein [Actinomadura citrea]|uniref:HD domain-containing protein n=1 Tax=Actinomadura citrea TaxID=46158 RepID=UPI003CE49CC9